MTENDRQEKDYSAVLVNHWIDKARNDLESAQVKFQSGFTWLRDLSSTLSTKL